MIQHYKNHRKIGVLKNSRSPIIILLCTKDLPDMWLIDLVRYHKRTGEIREDAYILQPDLQKHLEYWRGRRFNGLIRRRFNVSGEVVSFS